MSARLREWIVVGGVWLALAAAAAGSAGSDWKEIETVGKRVTKISEDGGRGRDLYNNLCLLRLRAESFIAAYPTDKRRWEAELVRLQTEMHLTGINREEPNWAAQANGYASVAAAAGAPAATRAAAHAGYFAARMQLVGRNDAAGRTALAAEVDACYDKNRNSPELAQTALTVAEWVEPVDSARAESILKKIAKAGDGKIPAKAEAMLRVVEVKRQPLEIAFTAIDGRKVDLKDLRGKVVLVDFWATWCPPCRDETPTLVAVYERYHGRGFEIVGISLDESRSALADYVKKHGMAWPQYFDGQGWDNRLSRKFGITSIPAMWLLGKDGMLMDIRGDDDLAGKIEKLLAR